MIFPRRRNTGWQHRIDYPSAMFYVWQGDWRQMEWLPRIVGAGYEWGVGFLFVSISLTVVWLIRPVSVMPSIASSSSDTVVGAWCWRMSTLLRSFFIIIVRSSGFTLLNRWFTDLCHSYGTLQKQSCSLCLNCMIIIMIMIHDGQRYSVTWFKQTGRK